MTETWYTDVDGTTYDSSGKVVIDNLIRLPVQIHSVVQQRDYDPQVHKFRLGDFDLRGGSKGPQGYFDRNGLRGFHNISNQNKKAISRGFALGLYSFFAPVVAGGTVVFAVSQGLLFGLAKILEN